MRTARLTRLPMQNTYRGVRHTIAKGPSLEHPQGGRSGSACGAGKQDGRDLRGSDEGRGIANRQTHHLSPHRRRSRFTGSRAAPNDGRERMHAGPAANFTGDARRDGCAGAGVRLQTGAWPLPAGDRMLAERPPGHPNSQRSRTWKLPWTRSCRGPAWPRPTS
jgi:hypothetical protein